MMNLVLTDNKAQEVALEAIITKEFLIRMQIRIRVIAKSMWV